MNASTRPIGPLRFVGEPAPISADALLAVELAAGATIPPTLREAVGRWGWGKLADVFFLSFTKERPHDLGSLAKTMPGGQDATWVLLGADESREHALYCVALGGTHGFVHQRSGGPTKLIGWGEPALFDWLSGPGLEKLYVDPLGAPPATTWASLDASGGVGKTLERAFRSASPDDAERAIETLLAHVSRHRLGWEALHLLMERELAIPDKRRKVLVTLVLQHTKKNVWKSLGAQTALLETVQGLKKNGRFLTPPPTTIASPFEGVTVEWSSTHDFLHVRAKTTGTWVLTLSTHEVSGLHRLAHVIVVDAVSGIVSTGMSLYAGARSAHVSMEPASEDNDHLVRGVNRFFHEDGTVTETTGHGDPAQLANKSPLHRAGAPAELHGSPYYWPGRTGWWRRGKLHREDGPALYIPHFGGTPADRARGVTAWYFDGELHRDFGPARIHSDGRMEWWSRGQPREETAEEAEARARGDEPFPRW